MKGNGAARLQAHIHTHIHTYIHTYPFLIVFKLLASQPADIYDIWAYGRRRIGRPVIDKMNSAANVCTHLKRNKIGSRDSRCSTYIRLQSQQLSEYQIWQTLIPTHPRTSLILFKYYKNYLLWHPFQHNLAMSFSVLSTLPLPVYLSHSSSSGYTPSPSQTSLALLPKLVVKHPHLSVRTQLRYSPDIFFFKSNHHFSFHISKKKSDELFL
jgi:hypothetical protein